MAAAKKPPFVPGQKARGPDGAIVTIVSVDPDGYTVRRADGSTWVTGLTGVKPLQNPGAGGVGAGGGARVAKPPPVIKVPPAPAKPQTGLGAKLDAMLKAHGPAWRQYEGTILKWAGVYNIDPLYVAAVLLTENPSADPHARSSAGALGPAQILDKSINPNTNPNAVWDGPAVLTDAWKQNFNNAVKYVSWRMAGHINTYSGLDAGYSQGYNPGYTGTAPSKLLPHGYVPTTGPGTQATPVETAGPSVAGTTARAGLTDPWVVVTAKGGLKTVKATAPPKNAVKDATGQAYQLSDFNRVARSLDTLYLAWTGVRAKPRDVQKYILSPVSDYELTQRLSNPTLNARLKKSPIWQTHAPEYEAIYKSVYGNDAQADSKEITYAIAHNLTQSGFTQRLRDRSDYSASEEYKGAAAQFQSYYENIYGTPDQTGHAAIDHAVRQGMNGDQWQQYLRHQPEYTGSGEFRRNVYTLLGNMGLIQGGQTVLGNG